MRFHEKLQGLRRGKGLSQEDLAEVLGVSRQAVSKWESGGSYPEMENLIGLSELFSVSLDVLMKDSLDVRHEGVGVSSGEGACAGCCGGFSWGMREYEYKSERTFFGVPVVHISFGRGKRQARGIIALGNSAVGVVAVGFAAVGVVSVGLFALGVLSFAMFGVGLISFGAVAVGALAFGGIAVGFLAFGGIAVGMYALGGCAIASRVAIGGYACGTIAIGDTVDGLRSIALESRSFLSISRLEVRSLIMQEFPDISAWILRVLLMPFR